MNAMPVSYRYSGVTYLLQAFFGVVFGEGLVGNGDVPAGGFSFNEDGTCINESKESFPGVGDGVGVGEVGFSCAGVGCGFFGVASMRAPRSKV